MSLVPTFVFPNQLAEYRAQVQGERDGIAGALASCQGKGAPGITADVMAQFKTLSDAIDAWAAETFPIDFTNYAAEYDKGQKLEGPLLAVYGPLAKQCTGLSGTSTTGLQPTGDAGSGSGGAVGVLAKAGAITGIILLVAGVGAAYVAVKYGRKAIPV